MSVLLSLGRARQAKVEVYLASLVRTSGGRQEAINVLRCKGYDSKSIPSYLKSDTELVGILVNFTLLQHIFWLLVPPEKRR